MSYNPREYWPKVLRRQGALYVAPRNSEEVFDMQRNIFTDAILQICPDRVGRLLDFGCGVGRFAEAMMGVAESYVGADLNEGAFEFAPKIEGASYVGLPEDRLPFEDGEFDSAMAVTVLQHIVEPAQYDIWSAELSRVVKPGGSFLIIDDAHGGLKGWAEETGRTKCTYMNVRSPEVIAESLGAEVEHELPKLLVERKRPSHFCFRAKKRDS